MIVKLHILMGFLLISLLSFSQTGYPKTILLGTDSVIVITHDQLKQVNTCIIDRERYIELVNNYKSQLFTTESMLSDYKSSFTLLNNQKTALDKIIIEKDTIILDYKDCLLKSNKKLTLFKAISGVSVCISFTLFTLLLIK